MGNKFFSLTPKTDATTPLKLSPGLHRVRTEHILLRKSPDTRLLAAKHVLDLAESISVLGPLEPLVLDTEGHLLAGGHRLAALQLLAISDEAKRIGYFWECVPADQKDKESETKAWTQLKERVGHLQLFTRHAKDLIEGAPVLVMDVRGKDHEGAERLALAVELAENNVRRNYTTDEIRDLAARLKKAGYKSTRGRPRLDERPAITILEAAVGKSRRTIERIIKGEEGKEKTPWVNARIAFKRGAKAIIDQAGRQQNQEAKKLKIYAKRVLALLESVDGSK